MTRSERLFSWFDRLEEAFIAFALALMTLLTFVQVVLRYLFQSGLVWSLEATTTTFGWLVVVGMAYGVRTHAHIAVDVLTRRLPEALRRTVAGIAFAVCLVYCGLMIVGSFQFVSGLARLGLYAQDIPLPRWVLASILPIGFALLALRLIQAGWRYFMPDRAQAVDGELL